EPGSATHDNRAVRSKAVSRCVRSETLQEDVFGRLYRIRFHDYEPLLLVEVMNATPEPDGSVRRHLLRVPPGVETAHEAVAWSFGRRTKNYAPVVQTCMPE